jgi:hypothetical protein
MEHQTSMHTITIEKNDSGYTVWQNGKVQEGLDWHECIGMVTELTHPKLGSPRIAMHTPEFWKADKEYRDARYKFDQVKREEQIQDFTNMEEGAF